MSNPPSMEIRKDEIKTPATRRVLEKDYPKDNETYDDPLRRKGDPN